MIRVPISLWDIRNGANTERFQGSVLLLPHFCLLSVPKGGGIFGKPLNRAILNTLGLHAVLTTCLMFLSVWTVPVLLAASFCQ